MKPDAAVAVVAIGAGLALSFLAGWLLRGTSVLEAFVVFVLGLAVGALAWRR